MAGADQSIVSVSSTWMSLSLLVPSQPPKTYIFLRYLERERER